MSGHPFNYDRWATPDDPEFGVVRVGDLRKIERACLGIWAIARVMDNRASDSGATEEQLFDAWIVSNLVGGVESLCDRMAGLSDAAIDLSSSDAVAEVAMPHPCQCRKPTEFVNSSRLPRLNKVLNLILRVRVEMSPCILL